MNFNIKLNALLWEICKLGRAAAACTSWNSVHSAVINRQQVIWESLGPVSGVTNSICEKLPSLLGAWLWNNASARWWKFLSDWIPSVPRAQGPVRSSSTLASAAARVSQLCLLWVTFPLHEGRLGSVPLQQETTCTFPVLWGALGWFWWFPPRQNCELWAQEPGGVSREILCWDKWIRTTSHGQQ